MGVNVIRITNNITDEEFIIHEGVPGKAILSLMDLVIGNGILQMAVLLREGTELEDEGTQLSQMTIDFLTWVSTSESDGVRTIALRPTEETLEILYTEVTATNELIKPMGLELSYLIGETHIVLTVRAKPELVDEEEEELISDEEAELLAAEATAD